MCNNVYETRISQNIHSKQHGIVEVQVGHPVEEKWCLLAIAVVIQALGATSPATGAPPQPHISFPAHLIIILICVYMYLLEVEGIHVTEGWP